MRDKSLNPKKLQELMENASQTGWQSMQSSDFERAAAAYEEAMNAARQLEDLQAAAIFLSYLAIARRNLGQLDAAEEALSECLDLASEHGFDRVKAHASLLLGEQEREQGNIESAIQHFLRGLEASLACDDEVGVEMAFGNLGLVYLEKGWAEQASECFRQAIERGENSHNKAAWLGSLGQCMAELAQFDLALKYYEQAFELAKAGQNVVSQAICRGSAGNAFFEKEEFERAAASYVEAIELSKAAQDVPRQGIWLGNLSNAYRKLGQNQKAIETCEEALSVAQTLGDKHSEAAHLDTLGECHMATGAMDKALASYEKALKLSQSIEDRQGQRIYLSNLGRVHQRLGQFEPAFQLFSLAIDLFDEQRSKIKSDDLKTSFAARGQDLYRDMVNVCLAMGRRVEALEYVGRAKSRAILDLLSNSPIDVSELMQGSDQTLNKLVAKEAQLRSQIARLEKIYWQGPAAETGTRGATLSREEAQDLYGQWRDAINQLRRRHPNYANLIAVETLSFSDVKSLWEKSDRAAQIGKKSLLDANVAIVEYYWTEEYFLAGAVFKGCEEPAIHVIRDADVLGSLRADIADFLIMSSTEGWDVPLSLCKRLHDSLLAPLLSGLPKKVNRLILVPHGTLYRLPFSALHDGERFLIERYSLSYLPTTSLIPVLARPQLESPDANGKPKYLVSAISDYSATRKEGLSLSARLRSASGLEDLSYTLEEARTVADLGTKNASEARLLTNQEVKESLPALFSEYPVVHFAGHAVFNPEEPLASGLVLSDGSMLTAAAILQGNILRTHCGKLLVLSACQTGVNMVTPGGEILGLARALMYAGMPNLILSLWEVADRSTSELMKDFHHSWQAGKTSVAAALQAAQKKAAADKQPVHAWAPFIHLGID
jgi:CHAT domain-containing protein/tetratricopeptide (TPR) repeat protein